MSMISIKSVKRERAEHCKALRRKYGDNSGMVRFSDKQFNIGYDIMSTVTTVLKDNIVIEIYDNSL